MTGSRRSSPSDDLVGRARAGALGGDDGRDGSEEFNPVSPADEYLADIARAGSSGVEESPTELDASTIAAELLAAGQIDADVDVEAEEERVAPASLPAWAVGEPPDGMAPPTITPEVVSSPSGEMLRSNGDSEIPEGDRWSTSTAEWEEREALKRQRTKRRFDLPLPGIRALVAIGVLGFAAIGWIGSMLDGREYLVDASIGDCFTVGTADQIEQVPIVDCAEEHDSELFARVDMAPAFGSAFAGTDPMFDWLMAECIDRFRDYAGEPYETSPYWVDVYIPTSEAWSAGDRNGVCTLVVVDENLNVISTTGSGRSTNSA